MTKTQFEYQQYALDLEISNWQDRARLELIKQALDAERTDARLERADFAHEVEVDFD